MNRDEALAKALKLLRLAESSNPNEAALAAQRAQEILLKYQLTEDMLKDENVLEKDEEIKNNFQEPIDKHNRRLIRWKSYLARTIAKANSCKTYIHNGVNIAIIGRDSDIKTTRYLYMQLVIQVEALANVFAKGQGKTYANNFRFGVVDAIEEKLKEGKQKLINEMKQEYNNNPQALVRLDKAIAKMEYRMTSVNDWVKHNLKLNKMYGSMTSDQSAREKGKAAGRAYVSVNNNSRGALNAPRKT